MEREKRAVLIALFALNYEIARTREVVTDTRLGHIRLQWWRDEIAKIYDGGACGEIPALSTLAPLIHGGILSREYFDDLLYAREFDLEDAAPSSVDGLRNYAAFTVGPLNRLALEIIGEKADEAEIRHISTVFGLFQAIRSVPLMLARGQCLLPADMLARKNLTPQKIIDFNCKQEIVDVIEELIRGIESYRKPGNRFLALQQRQALIWLEYIKKNDFDVFSARAQLSPPFLALRLWLYAITVRLPFLP